MNYREEDGDLFDLPEDFYLAHCISADRKMNAGIALEFKKRFDFDELYEKRLAVGRSYMTGRVIHIVTKDHYWEKPNIDDFIDAMIHLSTICRTHGIKKLGIPQIGAGLDGLNWSKNRLIIKEIFSGQDIEIVVRLN